MNSTTTATAMEDKATLVRVSIASALAAMGSLRVLHTDGAHLPLSARVIDGLLQFILQKGVVHKLPEVRNAVLLAVRTPPIHPRGHRPVLTLPRNRESA